MKRNVKVLLVFWLLVTMILPMMAHADSKAFSIVTDDIRETISNYLGYHPIFVDEVEDATRIMVRGGVLIPVRFEKQSGKYVVSAERLMEIRHKYAYPITGEQAYVPYETMLTFLNDYASGTIIRQYLDDVIEIYGGEGLHLRLSFDNGIIKGNDGSFLYDAEKIAQFVFDWECGE